MKSLTANVTEPTYRSARIAAVKAGQSLRAWAGEVIESRLAEKRAAMKRGPKLSQQ